MRRAVGAEGRGDGRAEGGREQERRAVGGDGQGDGRAEGGREQDRRGAGAEGRGDRRAEGGREQERRAVGGDGQGDGRADRERMPEVRPATREERGDEIENGERESESELHDSSLLDELFNMVVEVDNCNQQQDAPRVTPSSASTSTAQMSGVNKALSSHMFYPHKGNDAVFGRRKLVERFPCAVTSEKWRQIYNEKDDATNKRNKQERKNVRRSEN